MKTRSIMIVGVGGQGSLLASRIIGNVLLSQGFDVKVSEVPRNEPSVAALLLHTLSTAARYARL